jgi:hypothetical protein
MTLRRQDLSARRRGELVGNRCPTTLEHPPRIAPGPNQTCTVRTERLPLRVREAVARLATPTDAAFQ